MAKIDIAEAAFAGFQVLGRRPLAAVVWALVYVVFFLVLLLAFGGTVVAVISTLIKHGSQPPAPAVLLGLLGGFLGFYVILLLGSIVLGAVVACAVFRAVLNPEASSFFYMRLGASELWLMLVSFTQGVLSFMLQIALSIPVGIVTFALAALNHGNAGVVVAISLILRLLIYGLVIWLYLRFSLAGPMTFADRQFRLFESWTLTRGHAWSILAVGLLVGLVSAVIYGLLTVTGLIGGIAIWSAAPPTAALGTLFDQAPSLWLGRLAPIIIMVALLLLIGGSILTPIFLAPWARIYGRLRPEADIASTFA
jgi:xanthosine utilization system XapX-like protein